MNLLNSLRNLEKSFTSYVHRKLWVLLPPNWEG